MDLLLILILFFNKHSHTIWHFYLIYLDVDLKVHNGKPSRKNYRHKNISKEWMKRGREKIAIQKKEAFLDINWIYILLPEYF